MLVEALPKRETAIMNWFAASPVGAALLHSNLYQMKLFLSAF